MTFLATVPTSDLLSIFLFHLGFIVRRRSYTRAFFAALIGNLGACWELHSSNHDVSACQVRSVFVSSTDKETPYAGFTQSPRNSITVFTRSSSSIGAFIDARWAELEYKVAACLCIGWPVYFIRTNVVCRAALPEVVIPLYPSSLHIFSDSS